MKVLHLASFHGNIGDNANHSGFRPWLEKLAGHAIEWTDLEIREFFRSWGLRKFDESFVELVNQFDLFVIGGGNYFELWVDHSATGTSIDIAPELFARIRPPVFFNALGCDSGQGTTENTVRRFNVFLEAVMASERALVTLRNDGAQKTLRRYVPQAIADRIVTIPDGGFFLDHEKLPKAGKRIGINLASDMPEVRFAGFPGGMGQFCEEFAAFLDGLDSDFVFFPHIFRDLEIISAVLNRMNDRVRRTRATVAPYLSGAEGARAVFSLYSQCDSILAMRFHANVCALAMGLPTIGLNNYPQIEFLYEELNDERRCVSVKNPDFAGALKNSLRTVDAPNVMPGVVAQRAAFEPILSAWLEEHA